MSGPELVDLAARRLGGMVLAASDEFFAPKERLLEPGDPVFDSARYSDRGKEMDGWESRRRRVPGEDWVLVRLGVPGIVRRLLVDTRFFTGNHPTGCRLEGCGVAGFPSVEALLDPAVTWLPLLDDRTVVGDALQGFDVESDVRVTHLRFTIVPDGGVARVRALGTPLPDLRRASRRARAIDLAALVNGGVVLDCSDRHYSAPVNLIGVGDSRDMRDGWETRRRRDGGNDWVMLQLAAQGVIDRVELDTTNFKGNYPDRASVELRDGDGAWRCVLDRVPLAPHARHVFDVDDTDAATQARLTIHPDGGVARLRLFGQVTDDGWRAMTVRLLDAVPEQELAAELRRCNAAAAWASGVAARRPFGSFAALTAAADEVWAELPPAAWEEALAAHPRIGEGAGSAWSAQEQAGAGAAPDAVLAAIAEGNRAYEQRFGRVFIIRATGRFAEDVLAELRHRLGADPETELRTAAEEQRQITRLRLEKLMRPEGAPA